MVYDLIDEYIVQIGFLELAFLFLVIGRHFESTSLLQFSSTATSTIILGQQ